MSDNSVLYKYAYTDRDGVTYRCEIEIRVADMVEYLAARATRNRTKRCTIAFGKAVARPVKR